MNQQEKNIQIIKDVFAAVNRGDVQYMLNLVADNVDWQSPVTNTITEPVSWSKPRKNRNEVAAFFRELSEKVKITEMKPINFIAQDNLVIVEGTMRGTVNSTQREYATNWLMMITLENGKCVRLRNYYDTADISKAFLMEMRKAA